MLKADWPFGYDMAAARVLMLVTVANVAWRGTCMQAHAQSPDPHPIIRSGGTVTVVAPLQQPIVLQSMMNSSVSNLVRDGTCGHMSVLLSSQPQNTVLSH
jgi:hypothetical protein